MPTFSPQNDAKVPITTGLKSHVTSLPKTSFICSPFVLSLLKGILHGVFMFVACSSPMSASTPEPTLTNVRYGPLERNVLDFWQAPAASRDHPAALVVFIHGGGWSKGDKAQVLTSSMVANCLKAGMSFAAINYRFRTSATLPEILRDCARAIQFLRSQAAAWKIDPQRIGAYGSSAGAGTSLWLAFHPDLADPDNPDPVLRESSRLQCVGSMSGQFSYDPLRWREIFSDELMAKYGKWAVNPAFYGLKSEADFGTPEGIKVRADCDIIGLMKENAPPLFIRSSLPSAKVDNMSEFLHSPIHSKRLFDRARELRLHVIADIPAFGITPPKDGPETLTAFFAHCLGAKPGDL